jgi:predicted transcriptional regulator
MIKTREQIKYALRGILTIQEDTASLIADYIEVVQDDAVAYGEKLSRSLVVIKDDERIAMEKELNRTFKINVELRDLLEEANKRANDAENKLIDLKKF